MGGKLASFCYFLPARFQIINILDIYRSSQESFVMIIPYMVFVYLGLNVLNKSSMFQKKFFEVIQFSF